MANYNVDEIYEDLKKNPDDVVVDAAEAVEIWKMFRGYPVTQDQVASFNNRAFLQACLMVAQDASAAMGWIEALFRSAYKPNASVKGIMKKLVKEAFRQYFRKFHAKLSDLKSLDLYQMVVNQISATNAPRFQWMEQFGNPDMTAE
jgi:hypothetical protein